MSRGPAIVYECERWPGITVGDIRKGIAANRTELCFSMILLWNESCILRRHMRADALYTTVIQVTVFPCVPCVPCGEKGNPPLSLPAAFHCALCVLCGEKIAPNFATRDNLKIAPVHSVRRNLTQIGTTGRMTAVRRHSPLAKIVVRASLVYVPLRIMVSFFSLKPDSTVALTLDNPPGIVLLVALLGFIETRARSERLFWANLGYGIPVIVATFAAVATVGECTIAWFT